jgi:hypothetical protein
MSRFETPGIVEITDSYSDTTATIRPEIRVIYSHPKSKIEDRRPDGRVNGA